MDSDETIHYIKVITLFPRGIILPASLRAPSQPDVMLQYMLGYTAVCVLLRVLELPLASGGKKETHSRSLYI